VNATAPAPTRRLFFALWPDDATRDALSQATRRLARHCGGKPVPAGNLHITLAFLGHLPEERFEDVRRAGVGLVAERLTLRLDRFGYFAAPQVLWFGAAEVPVGLTALADALRRRLAAGELPSDPRPFHAHLTIARKVRAPPELPRPRPVEWLLTGFALVESQTLPEGARYRVVAEYPGGAER
jgi:2'-5' RNA ligase